MNYLYIADALARVALLLLGVAIIYTVYRVGMELVRKFDERLGKMELLATRGIRVSIADDIREHCASHPKVSMSDVMRIVEGRRR